METSETSTAMAEKTKESIFKGVDILSEKNNIQHHTSEISLNELIVRRGQSFKMILKLKKPFNHYLHPLRISAKTGKHSTEEQGTASFFGIPDVMDRSPSAKAVWKVELHKDSTPLTGKLILSITPPADAPIGEYVLTVNHRNEETLLAKLVVLFNPWCPDDSVYLKDEKEKEEYVMNEEGIIYTGSKNYIFPRNWDLGQFEDDMVVICLMILDLNHKHKDDPGADVSSRSDPIYVSRVVSAMINSKDDQGVLEGRWGGPFGAGYKPSHWSGSHTILKRWYNVNGYPVKYGQCWVFAGVMCSVMRLLGIPCRVVSNFESAHDTNMNLTIDMYHADYGVREKESHDNVWNFHVWVEGWMKRPDLAQDGKYDGWQVLDPTPQEMSDGIYCCGPAPVKAILSGQTDLKYDVPFVFAEVNADCIDWLVKADGSQIKIYSETARIGQNISTKSVVSRKRLNITDTYKQREGTEKERSVYNYAITRDYSRVDEDEEMEEESIEVEETEDDAESEGAEEEDDDEETEEGAETGGTEGGDAVNETARSMDEVNRVITPPPPVVIRFEEVKPPTNGKDVRLKVVLQSSIARQLSINISVQAMRYNGTPAGNIQSEVKEKTLKPGKDLSIPVRVPFSAYHKHMVDCDSMKVAVMVTDKEKPNNVYLAEDDVVLLDPPISVTGVGKVRLQCMSQGEVVFMNPINEILTECTLTLSGSGLWKDEIITKIPDMKPKTRIRVKFFFVPYKSGKKTILADFDCSTFRDIKASCTVHVKP